MVESISQQHSNENHRITPLPLQSPHPFKWANKTVGDEWWKKRNDDKNRGGGRLKGAMRAATWTTTMNLETKNNEKYENNNVKSSHKADELYHEVSVFCYLYMHSSNACLKRTFYLLLLLYIHLITVPLEYT